LRYKSLPLSVRSRPKLGRRSADAGQRPSGDRRQRFTDWLATIPILLLVPILILPLIAVWAAQPYLAAETSAVQGEPLALRGGNFPSRTWVQLQWDGSPDPLGVIRTRNDGSFSGRVTPPASGTHVITAVVRSKGTNKKSGGAQTVSASLTIEVSPTAPTESTPASPTPIPPSTETAVPSPTASVSAAPSAQETTSPTPTALPSSEPRPTSGGIWFGAWIDQNWRNTPASWASMITDLKSHGLDSVVSVNGFVRYHLPLLDISDRERFGVFTSMVHGELNEQWWGRTTVDGAKAESIIGPLVDALKVHPSVIGYNYIDDAPQSLMEKMRLAEEVFERHDPLRYASPTLTDGTYARAIYDYVRPTVFLFYHYPATESYPNPCSWAIDWPTKIRTTIAGKEPGVPVYMGLQTHRTWSGPIGTKLRYPAVQELRLQAWIALGEGVKGLWWFHYDDNPSGEWVGFRNQPRTYDEITDLARHITFMEATIGALRKIPDAYTASGGYVSTMTANGKPYLIVANQSCAAQDLVLKPFVRVRDMETGNVYAAGQAIPFRGGDGRLLEILPD